MFRFSSLARAKKNFWLAGACLNGACCSQHQTNKYPTDVRAESPPVCSRRARGGLGIDESIVPFCENSVFKVLRHCTP